jgi:hypothetical protein
MDVETWSLKKDHRLEVSENKVLRSISETRKYQRNGEH